MINELLHPPRPKPSPPVFDDPRGQRRRIVTTVGVVVCILCLCVLGVGASVLYADPKAPATGGAAEARNTTDTTARR
ncbi:hypothetical protein ACFCYI_12950 [Streptomyces sp. NPDC056257]|uniref:hypothetical protein n=1 Tax=Streptomyces sp. NPDC056257 TaxID=3345765 RepID=UPI0035DB0390